MDEASCGKRKRSTKEREAPVFVRTLYSLLKDCDESVGRWSEDGKQIVIVDPARFAAEVCPKFFRHRNFNSFTRLLNMYQFHKVQGTSQDSKLACFAHVHFVRGDEEQLCKIQRKSPSSTADEREPRSGVEALVNRDVWEKTNQEIDEMQKSIHTSETVVVSTWMRRVLQLEQELKQLKEENEKLKHVEDERVQLLAQVSLQNKLITDIQNQVQMRIPVDPLALVQQHLSATTPTTSPADPVADALRSMGLDPQVVMAGLGLPVATTPTKSDLSACLNALSNPVNVVDFPSAHDPITDPAFDFLFSPFPPAHPKTQALQN